MKRKQSGPCLHLLQQVMEAYAECNSGRDYARQLNFRALGHASVTDAVEIMERALGSDGSYNEFVPEALGLLPEDCWVYLAREYSPCVYVKTTTPIHDVKGLKKRMKANDFQLLPNGDYRIWWD